MLIYLSKKELQMDNNTKQTKQNIETSCVEMDDVFNDHMTKLHIVGRYMAAKDFKKLIKYIQDEYFSKTIFDQTYYIAADDFIFKMDITGLSYSSIFEMAYRDLEKNDYGQYLLGLKMILVKLKGNQRYSYYDRTGIIEALKYMEEEYSLEAFHDQDTDVLDIVDVQSLKDCPVGFEELTFEEYMKHSTRSIYIRDIAKSEKFFESELKTAVNKGIIYHYIVETDHYINTDIQSTTYQEWVYLAKLLALYYTTEKKPWTRDMTKDMLRIYSGMRDCCELQKFEETIFHITTGNLKLIIKKISRDMLQEGAEEITEVVNYLINVYAIHKDERYIDYITDLLLLIESSESQEKVKRVKEWLETIS
jgi:hypothetical protein